MSFLPFGLKFRISTLFRTLYRLFVVGMEVPFNTSQILWYQSWISVLQINVRHLKHQENTETFKVGAGRLLSNTHRVHTGLNSHNVSIIQWQNQKSNKNNPKHCIIR